MVRLTWKYTTEHRAGHQMSTHQDLHENMTMHLICTHGRSLAEVAGRSYDDLKAEHDGLQCPPAATA